MTERRIQALEAQVRTLQNQMVSGSSSANTSGASSVGTTYTEDSSFPLIVTAATTTSNTPVLIDLSSYVPSNAVRVRLTGVICLGVTTAPTFGTVYQAINCYLQNPSAASPDAYLVGLWDVTGAIQTSTNQIATYPSFSTFNVDVPIPQRKIRWVFYVNSTAGQLTGLSLAEVAINIAGYWT